MTKNDKNILAKHGEIVIYTSDDNEAKLDVKLEELVQERNVQKMHIPFYS